MKGLDVIGDIHGHASALTALLERLGYTSVKGVYRHATRLVVFAGDFIDRGPDQLEVLNIARSMVDSGSAQSVMGNHEFNAIGWATPDGKGGYLRAHTSKNESQHRKFLDQVGEGSLRHKEWISWLQTLPLWIDFNGLRVVHACWHKPSQANLSGYLDARTCLTEEGIIAAHTRGNKAYSAVDVLLKGPEVKLPDGHSFHDKDGHRRHEARLRWWDPCATTFKTAALGMEGRESDLSDDTIPMDYLYTEKVPLLFGHYWMRGEPEMLQPFASCLDYSVAKDGFLTAYRWSGEADLCAGHYHFVVGLFVCAGDKTKFGWLRRVLDGQHGPWTEPKMRSKPKAASPALITTAALTSQTPATTIPTQLPQLPKNVLVIDTETSGRAGARDPRRRASQRPSRGRGADRRPTPC